MRENIRNTSSKKDSLNYLNIYYNPNLKLDVIAIYCHLYFHVILVTKIKTVANQMKPELNFLHTVPLSRYAFSLPF